MYILGITNWLHWHNVIHVYQFLLRAQFTLTKKFNISVSKSCTQFTYTFINMHAVLLLAYFIHKHFVKNTRTTHLLTNTFLYLLYAWVKYFFTAVVTVYTLLYGCDLVPIHLIYIGIRLKKLNTKTHYQPLLYNGRVSHFPIG